MQSLNLIFYAGFISVVISIFVCFGVVTSTLLCLATLLRLHVLYEHVCIMLLKNKDG